MIHSEKINIEKLKSELVRLKFLLIIWTLIQISYFLIIMIHPIEIIKVIYQNNIDKILGILHLSITGIFIWFIWRKFSIDKKSNLNNSLMILFLGVIGMWIWYPDEKEINKLN